MITFNDTLEGLEFKCFEMKGSCNFFDKLLVSSNKPTFLMPSIVDKPIKIMVSILNKFNFSKNFSTESFDMVYPLLFTCFLVFSQLNAAQSVQYILFLCLFSSVIKFLVEFRGGRFETNSK